MVAVYSSADQVPRRSLGAAMLGTEDEFRSIVHHLRVAAERYEVDAVSTKESSLFGPAKESLAKTFKDQADEARLFADLIEREIG